MSDGLKFIGKRYADGEAVEAVLGIAASDLSGDEIQRYAKQRGVTPADLKKDLLGSGLYRESPAEKPEPTKADSGKAADKE